MRQESVGEGRMRQERVGEGRGGQGREWTESDGNTNRCPYGAYVTCAYLVACDCLRGSGTVGRCSEER
jgi:hypothetical protein